MEGDINDPPEHQRLEHALASKWLSIDYADCFMYGIESSFMEIYGIPIVIDNLESGNLFFHELMPDEMYEHNEATKEVQQSLEKMIEEDPSQYIARLKINSSSEQKIQ